ncbi:Abi-alpha family protein [Nocardia uniformis]|uniref:Abi-alpha family protein n=1 Tax=Nocardia uniformis TaxID=53432 RepID=UPI001FE13932|nr:Abi-alpha family protein [Nocardia uniformis]
MTESASDNDDYPEFSTELVVRPTPPVPAVPEPARPAAGPVGSVARVAWSALAGATSWGLGTALGVTGTVLRGSLAGQPPRDILSDAHAQVRDSMRRALGVHPTAEVEAAPETSPVTELRARGAELLRQSADLHSTDVSHPAYARILDQLAPDEARIVRYLYLDGPQPAIDVRTGRTGNGGRFNLVGDDAGLRYPGRIDEYLTNLRRLGLLDFGREPLGNPNRYQLLESLPEVRKLLKRAGFGTKVLYRSIELTSFGGGFVRTCLPVPSLDQAL